jgi:hypothetical protein
MAEFNTTCPHCETVLQAQEEWIGMTVECPQCQKTFTISVPNTDNDISHQSETFTFVCPSCDTMVELPSTLAGKKYACKACCEEHIAEPATEKKCPYCQQMIKINAKTCKFCKKQVSAILLSDKIKQKSNDILVTSRQISQKIKARLNLKRTIFIISCLFFLASCIVFGVAVFSDKPEMWKYGEVSGSEGTSVSTSSYSSISVGESSYGTYKNSIRIADNTKELVGITNSGFEGLRCYYRDDQRRKILFNSSYSLLGIALFLLFVSFFIDQIFDKKEIIAANQVQESEKSDALQ